MIDHFEAIKHELIFLWLKQLVHSLYSSYIKVLVDAVVHSEDGKVKPGSVERSLGLYQRAGDTFNVRYQ
jgi:hypothetical protein